MVLNKIKNLISGANSSVETEYNQIIENLSLDSDNQAHVSDIKMI